MHSYTEDELNDKIHAFLAKKSQKFSGLNDITVKSKYKSSYGERRGLDRFVNFGKSNAFWATLIYS